MSNRTSNPASLQESLVVLNDVLSDPPREETDTQRFDTTSIHDIRQTVEDLATTVRHALNEMKKVTSGRLIPRDVTPALEILRDFFWGDHTSFIPPQIIVNVDKKQIAFGRKTLASMGYQGAINLFVTRFASEEDWSLTQHGWFAIPRRPDIAIYATFLPHKNDRTDPILLDMSSWMELVPSVDELYIVFSKRSDV